MTTQTGSGARKAGEDLTVCTVFISRDVPYVQLGLKLITELNPQNDWKWLLVDNSQDSSGAARELAADRCVIIDGAESDEGIPEWCRGSYQHAAGFNKASSYLGTRFVLFLDPDFYIVRQGWIDEVLGHMVKHDLSFFGAPYHPKWFRKYRYFPTGVCLFVDLSKVSAESLDFTPDLVRNAAQLGQGSGHKATSVRRRAPFRRRLLSRVAGIAQTDLHLKAKRHLHLIGRGGIGSKRDTGYEIFQRYHQKRGVFYECTVPVYRPRSEFLGPKHAFSARSRVVERVLPDRWCFFPKRRDYYSQTGFRELGFSDPGSRGWEEFLWQGKPFGFHLRRTRLSDRDIRKEQITLEHILSQFLYDGPRVAENG